jgi:hypothetical protein
MLQSRRNKKWRFLEHVEYLIAASQKMAATGQQTITKHFSQVSSRREEIPRKVLINPTANM